MVTPKPHNFPMADHIDTDTQILGSPSDPPSSPSPGKEADGGELDNTLGYFEDTVAVDSPLAETELENLGFDSELVDDEYGEEVVPDSEDEGVRGSVVSGVLDGRFKGNVLEMQRGQLSSPRKRAEDVVADSDDSNHEKSNAGNETSSINLNQSHPPIRGYNFPRSQEPGESSQDNALNFVDRFLSFNNVDLSPGVDNRKTVREKSPLVPSAKGAQTLVKRIRRGTSIGKTGTFEWTDSDQHGEGESDFFCKRVGASVDFGGCRQRSVNGYQEARNVQASQNNSVKELDNQLDARLTGQQLEDSDIGRDASNMFDIGFGTQVAAEAMEALACGPPAGSSYSDAYGGLESTLDKSLRGVTEKKARLGHSSFRKSACSDAGDIPTKLTRRKRSARRFNRGGSGLFQKKSETKELGLELAVTTKVKKGKSSTEKQLHCGNYSDANGNSGRKSDKPIMQRIAEESSGRAKLREFEIDMCSSISVEHTSIGKGHSQGKCINLSPVSQRTKPLMSEVKLISSKDQFDNPGERINDGGIIQYRRKRSRIAADTVEVLSAREKCSTQEVAALDSSLRSNPWRYPRRKRTRHNVQSHSNGPRNLYVPFTTVYAKGSNVHSTKSHKISEDNGKVKGKAGSSVYVTPHWHSSENDFDRSLLVKNFDEPDSAGAIPNCESAVINTRLFPTGLCRASALMQSGNLDGKEYTSFADGTEKNHKMEVPSKKTIEPSGSESTITFSSTKGRNAASSNCLYYDYHKKPCYKNLPKSFLLKELIRLGAPESIPDITWKDLRRRRDMAHVRVLFSQHLDGGIIKQQKKILSRLGISLASCCRDATHFIADKFARTRNMLEAIALGKPVVTHLWLESCGQASCLIDEKNYFLRDTKKEKEIGFSMPVSLARASQHPLLKGQRVFITPSIKPAKEMITSLVKAVHGQPVERSQISAAKDEKVLDDLLILSCDEDHAICRPFLERGVAVYSSELLLNGIVIQKLEYKRHKLFIDQVQRNRLAHD